MGTLHFVRVLTDDRTYRLWAAATPRDQAVDRVLDVIPEGWSARLLDEPIDPRVMVGLLELSPGEVRELTDWKASANLSAVLREAQFSSVLPRHPE